MLKNTNALKDDKNQQAMLVDVHCHLDFPQYEPDLRQVIERAKIVGVSVIITNGVNAASNRKVLELAKFDPIIKLALGLYPLDALGFAEPENFNRNIQPIDVDAELAFIKSHAKDIIAIGEVGMDFKWTKEPEQMAKQKENFQKVIELAEQIKKPMLVHTRNAEKEIIEMLETTKAKAVLHCFQGNKKLIQRASDYGHYFSIPPVIARLQHFQLLARMVNINQLLTETDGPFLSPVPGQRNEPANVAVSVQKIAEAKKFDVEEVKKNIWLNYQRMFL